MRSKEDTDNSRRVFQSASTSGRYKYDMMPRCPDCGIHMKYIYGEMFECPVCHRQEQTQFGKVRSYLKNMVRSRQWLFQTKQVCRSMLLIIFYVRDGLKYRMVRRCISSASPVAQISVTEDTVRTAW